MLTRETERVVKTDFSSWPKSVALNRECNVLLSVPLLCFKAIVFFNVLSLSYSAVSFLGRKITQTYM